MDSTTATVAKSAAMPSIRINASEDGSGTMENVGPAAAPMIFRTIALEMVNIFFQHNFCIKPYLPREPRRSEEIEGSMNM